MAEEEVGSGEGRRPRVLLGVSGSVAAVKATSLLEALREFADVKVVATQAARHFLPGGSGDAGGDSEVLPLLGDESEWRQWRAVGDPVLHIELRRWADLLVVAPLSANTLAKAANGLCDNLLTCILRAWDFRAKPCLLAPAMNTLMWESPFTAKHLAVLADELGARVVPPVAKTLACGDVGVGAMASVDDIAAATRDASKGVR
mmetsp:Transcript_29312/g.95534  ORF Transcript_29312/g.95534 Transcript_29312/m.95534 type:complete len:203 (+) Transcript_29312:346-954(+)|eukprot:CAMPEP_0170143910 /NCGR_PEP_ID=MMETSP0033_2-20121228/13197_1 /TAXON_ID=195969 /ORGANISM="Dolichomastix tenuilepis, Strain CCMP3274" /LENGTH=202 /DNA_ID=CAMNT_0010380381 /DNA_START=245 /DNA_END=853 /DNA_ORIENTATION=+